MRTRRHDDDDRSPTVRVRPTARARHERSASHLRRAIAALFAIMLAIGAPSLLADESSTESRAPTSELLERPLPGLPGIFGRTGSSDTAPSASPVRRNDVSADNDASDALGFGAPSPDTRDDPAGIPTVDEAFRPIAREFDGDTVELAFDIGRCCYLYRDRFSVRGLDGLALGEPLFPPGESYHDEFYGETVVYRDALEFRVPVLARPAGDTAQLEIEVDYQGCADAGVCYPPQTRRLLIGPAATGTAAVTASATPLDGDLAVASEPFNAVAPSSGTASTAAYLSEQDRLGLALEARGLLALPLFFGLGVLLAFTPCVLPMVPILSGIIGARGATGTGRAFALSSVYVLVMAATYAAFGVLAAATGANLQAAFQHPVVIASSAALFVALALAMFGLYELQVPRTLQARLIALSGRQRGGEFLGVGLMGAFSALIVGPCVAAPLIGVLGYIAATGELATGGLTLFVMGLGMGLPLLVVGTSAGRFMPRAGAWTRVVKAGFGVGLIAVAIWLLERIVPSAVTLALWALLLMVLAVFLGVGRTVSAHPVQLLGKGLGLAMATFAALLLVGVGTGASDPLRPLEAFSMGSGDEPRAGTPAAPRFELVTTSAGLDAALSESRVNGRPLLLDFYADWCVTCKEMERYTFTDPAVAAAMSRFDLIKADVTANDAGNRELLERFSILGPPATLFFDAGGREQRSFRTAGFLDAERFLVVLEAALAEAGLALIGINDASAPPVGKSIVADDAPRALGRIAHPGSSG